MDGQLISKAPSQKYLGVTIDSKLSWSEHCHKVASKARSTLGIVRRSLPSAPQEVKSKAYQALVRPQLEYASAAWNPHTQKDVDTLQKVQNAAARFVTGNYLRGSSVTQMQKTLGWDTLTDRRMHAQLCMFYKIHNRLVHIDFPSYIQKPKRIPARSPHPFQYLRVQTSRETFFYSFFPRVIPVWNGLPITVVSASSIETFRSLALTQVQHLVPPVWIKRI